MSTTAPAGKEPATPDRPGAPVNVRRLTLILASLTAFSPFATDMYLASFPLLAESFRTDIGTVQLGLSVFFLGLALGPLLYGPMIDRLGRKPPLLAGAALFVVASLLIVVAPTIESFIALRLVQAVGGCAGMIVSRAIISDLFQPREAARILSLMMMVMGLAPIVAPVLGGYVSAAAGWQAVFVFLAGFGLVCLIIAWRGLPETLHAGGRRQETAGEILRSYAGLLSIRDFIVPTLAGSLTFACLFAFITGSPFVYMVLHGVSQQQYGWLFALNAAGLIVAAQANRLLLKRFGPRQVASWALIANVLAGALVALVGTSAPLAWLVALVWICIATVPVVGANATALAMAASGGHRGYGSAILSVAQFSMASAVSAAMGLLHTGTAHTMTVAILLCGVLASLVWFLGRTRRDEPA